MLNIDFTTLNELEKTIHETLQRATTNYNTIRISDAAMLCGCSISKISKCSKKLGFSNFKQYVDFLYNRDGESSPPSTELKRIQHFITNFDSSIVDEMVELIKGYERIVLFGYGPSLLCAEYIEYRLRTVTNKTIIAVVDEVSVASMSDSKTLLIILTVTGNYRNFKDMYEAASTKGAKVVIVAQYYNKSLIDQCDNIFFLTQEITSSSIIPHEQSRTLFFIFMEEVIGKIDRKKKEPISTNS